jgi:hypothetical protein
MSRQKQHGLRILLSFQTIETNLTSFGFTTMENCFRLPFFCFASAIGAASLEPTFFSVLSAGRGFGNIRSQKAALATFVRKCEENVSIFLATIVTDHKLSGETSTNLIRPSLIWTDVQGLTWLCLSSSLGTVCCSTLFQIDWYLQIVSGDNKLKGRIKAVRCKFHVPNACLGVI